MSGLKVGLVPVDAILFHPHNVRRDLGDLRSLAASIRRFGVMQPVILEQYGDNLRLRAGHRRVAAARIAGLAKVPAVIHAETLDDDEWLMASAHENAQRRGLDADERRRTVSALRDHGCSWEGIAEAFGVTAQTCRSWVTGDASPTPSDEAREGLKEKVDDLTRRGRSAAQIADSLGISARQVSRLRMDHRGATKGTHVQSSKLRSFVAAWRERPDATAADVLAAVERMAEYGRLRDALPNDQEAVA